jgi:hypothetical protein
MSLVDLLREPPDDAIVRFLEAWHGPATGQARQHSPNALPEVVRELEFLADRWPGTFAMNSLTQDPEWARDGDKRVFYVENQAVYFWATDGIGKDPAVWGRFSGSGSRWFAEREPLSRFLLQIVVFEAIMGAQHAAAVAALALPHIEAALEPLERLPFGSWRWPIEPTWFYAGADVLAIVNPNGKEPEGPADRFDIFLGARTAEALAYLREVDGVLWDREPDERFAS